MAVPLDYLLNRYGIVKSTIGEWVKKFPEMKVGRNQYDLAACDLVYINKLQEEIEKLSLVPENLSPDNPQARLTLAQCRKTEAEATLKELDIEERKGRLIERMAAIEEINNANARMETKMWGIPERYALELSGISDPQEIKRILQAAIDEGLAELQNNVFIR